MKTQSTLRGSHLYCADWLWLCTCVFKSKILEKEGKPHEVKRFIYLQTKEADLHTDYKRRGTTKNKIPILSD